MLLEGQYLGHYHILRLLGSGGMGDVYLAEDARIGQQVALKVLRTDAASGEAVREATRPFQREARVIAQLSHPHILPLFRYDEEAQGSGILMYLVIPYCRGGSLSQWLHLHQMKSLSVQDAAGIVHQIADALYHAHTAHIIHQDVKPSNVLLREPVEIPAQMDLLLADFGIARFSEVTARTSRDLRGTPAYMAPEQWRSQPLPATDQYALAILVYELLTGRLPFLGGFEQMLYQHLMVAPPPLSTLNLRIAPAVEAVVLRGLAKQAEERFPSIAEFAEAFSQAATASVGLSQEQVVTLSLEEAREGTTRTVVDSSGRELLLALPPGVGDGETLRLPAQPVVASTAEPSESVILTVLIEKHPSPPSNSPRTPLAVPFPARQETPPLLSPTRKRHRDNPLVILALAALVLIAGGSGLFLFIAGAHPPSSSLPAATHGGSGAARKLTTRPPLVLAPTPTFPPYVPRNAQLAFRDALTSPDHWRKVPANAFGTSCQFVKGGYQVQVTKLKWVDDCGGVGGRDYRNFVFAVHMRIVNGDCGGIDFRLANQEVAGYYFIVCQDGKYAVLNGSVNGPPAFLANYTFSSFIYSGLNANNAIAVVASGNQLDFYVNQRQIYSVNDNVYSHGLMDLNAGSYQDNVNLTQVVYWDASVWTL